MLRSLYAGSSLPAKPNPLRRRIAASYSCSSNYYIIHSLARPGMLNPPFSDYGTVAEIVMLIRGVICDLWPIVISVQLIGPRYF